VGPFVRPAAGGADQGTGETRQDAGEGGSREYQAQAREANDGWMGMEGLAICRQNKSEAGLVQGALDSLHFCSVCMGATGLKL
jgi:hypothetical protein